MSSLEAFRAEFRAASNEELVRRAAPPRGAAPALSAEAWLALTEELERRGLTPPDDTLAELALEEYQPAPPPAPRDPRTGLVRYAKAAIGRRLLATVIDWVVGIAPMALSFGVLGVAGLGSGDPPVLLTVLLLFLSVGWLFYYNFTKDGRANGQSVGKRATGLMVVNAETNQPCNRGKSALRALVMLGLGCLPFGGLVEPIAVLVDSDGRRLGDRAAGTQVIDVADYRPAGAPVD